MLPIFRIARPSNAAKGLEHAQLEQSAKAIVKTRRMLADNPCPDTFAGRKTQEPFPSEHDLPD